MTDAIPWDTDGVACSIKVSVSRVAETGFISDNLPLTDAIPTHVSM